MNYSGEQRQVIQTKNEHWDKVVNKLFNVYIIKYKCHSLQNSINMSN